MTSVAVTLARWAADLQPSQDDLELADCVRGLDTNPESWTWENTPGILRRFLPEQTWTS